MPANLPPDALERSQARLHPAEEPRRVPWVKVLLVVVGLVGVGVFGYPYWKYRMPQTRDLTDQQGVSRPVRLEARNDVLLEYTLPDSSAGRYLAIASLAPADREFVAHLPAKLQLKLPLDYLLPTGPGVETPVRLVARNDDWVQYTLLTDGSTHYAAITLLPADDQLLIRQFPVSFYFNYPVDYAFTGPPSPGVKIRIVARSDDSFKYLAIAESKSYTAPISVLSAADQAFVRALPVNLPGEPPAVNPNSPVPPQILVTATPANMPDASHPSATPPLGDGHGAPAAAVVPAAETVNSDHGISADQIKALVYIEGDESAGSGFIAKINGQYFVVTNQHVLSGNKQFTVTAADGSKLPTNGTLYGAVNYDVALLKIPDNLAKHSLEILDDPQTNAKVNDRVTVMGNNLGARVPVQIEGKLIGIGPEMIEVDAPFQPGNSGSPIIDRPSGKVVGIATMHISYNLEKLKNSVVTQSTRWFGCRLDNIDPQKGWQKLDWARFSADGIQLEKVDALYKTILSLVTGSVSPAAVHDDAVRRLLVNFQAAANNAADHKNRQDFALALQSLNGHLRGLVDTSIRSLTDHKLAAYHALLVDQQMEIQRFLDDTFTNSTKEIITIMHKEF